MAGPYRYNWVEKNQDCTFEIDGGGILRHSWGTYGQPITGHEHLNGPSGVAAGLPLLRPHSTVDITHDGGQLHLLVQDTSDNEYDVFQGDTEGLWHVAGAG